MERVNMVPGFILKLWKMINDPQCDDLIAWSDNGQSFIIMDTPKFSQELSKYFKHNNLSSFIRQLNMYGFRKVAAIENSGLHPINEDLHFYHPDFVKGRPDRLEAIKRKLPQKIAETLDLRNVIRGISDIEDKQKDVSKTLSEIKRENEMLWAELHDLRQKHQQQQLYISRLMKLVFEAMEQNGIKTNMLPVKRNSPLMIEGSDGTSHITKKTRITSPDEYNIEIPSYSIPTTSYDATLSQTNHLENQNQQEQQQLLPDPQHQQQEEQHDQLPTQALEQLEQLEQLEMQKLEQQIDTQQLEPQQLEQQFQALTSMQNHDGQQQTLEIPVDLQLSLDPDQNLFSDTSPKFKIFESIQSTDRQIDNLVLDFPDDNLQLFE